MEIAKRLRELRKERGVSYTAVARAINVDRHSVMLWEKEVNQPCASNIFDLAFYYSVSADYLLGLSDNKTVPNLHVK